MNTLIFRTMAPLLVAVMFIFSVFILLRGHNAPGGGFIGGLIAAAAVAIQAMAHGVPHARKALRVHPIAIAGFGVFLAAATGLPSAAFGVPFLTGLWLPPSGIGTPMVFDIGVYFTVFGTLAAVALTLEDDGEVN